MGVPVHRDLVLAHGFQQRRLRLGSSAVNLVSQQNVAEDRAALEFKALLGGGIHGDAEYIAGQHVAGELHPLEVAVQSSCQGLRQGCLSYARHTFDQQVTSGKQRHQRQPYHLVLSANHRAQCALQCNRALRGSLNRKGNHALRF
jgi:hypothetical protein